MSNNCPCCGQPLPEVRLGVRLTPLKARIFDAIRRNGFDGIDEDVLFWLIFSERKVMRTTLKSHINQINDLLAATDYWIDGRYGRYVMKCKQVKEAA